VKSDGLLRALIEAELEEASLQVIAFASIERRSRWPAGRPTGPAGCAVPGDAGVAVRRSL
jgi:hypothetical protein